MSKKFKAQNLSSEAEGTVEAQANIEQPSEEVAEKPTEEVVSEPVVEEQPVVKSNTTNVKYREVVYLGVAKSAERIGAVTGNVYVFSKDQYGMPVATQIDEKDYPSLISERGNGCARRDPSILFMSKLEWDLEIEQARIANNS